MTTLSTLNFDNHFARLGPEFSSPRPPYPLHEPYLVSANPDVAALIELDAKVVNTPAFINLVSGNWLPPGAEPIEMLYAGHQFGHFVPRLGDGRAILIGQVTNTRGESWDLQLKGADETRYSRLADGSAVLRSTLREYLCSEAIHHLGIPSTRSMGVIGSDSPVSGEAVETAALLLRVSPSHVRFGSFELFFYRNQHQHVKTLADYVIRQHFPDIAEAPGAELSYFSFLREVVVRTARLIADWQTVGFAHGVMNTDNMSIMGLTFDCGPYGFMEAFDPDLICNHSDESGRYAFSNQPTIAFWNLCCLAQALTPLLPVEKCREALSSFESVYSDAFMQNFAAKLGLHSPEEEDETLISGLLEILRGNAVDYTMFFRALCAFDSAPDAPNTAARQLFKYPEAFEYWSAGYRARLAQDGAADAARQAGMRAANPRYVLRDWLAQRAIDRAQQKDFSEVDRLLRLLRRPFDDQPGFENYAGPAPADFMASGVSCPD